MGAKEGCGAFGYSDALEGVGDYAEGFVMHEMCIRDRLCVVMALIGILDYDVIPFFVSMWGTPAGISILVMCAAALMAAFYIAFVPPLL